MPVLLIYGLAHNKRPKSFWGFREKDWEHLTRIRSEIKKAVASIEALHLREEHVTCFFLPTYGPPEKDVIIFVDGLFEKPERDEAVRNALATAIQKVIFGKIIRDNGKVEVFINPFRLENGFCSEELNLFRGMNLFEVAVSEKPADGH